MQLLEEITRFPQATQRDLSSRLGMALGLTNSILRELVRNGFVQIRSGRKEKVRYQVTQKGLLEKNRLTWEFIRHSFPFYERVRQLVRDQLRHLSEQGGKRLVLYGTDGLAEIACLTLEEMDLELVAVVDEADEQSHFLRYPVRAVKELPGLSFDVVLIACLSSSRHAMERLNAAGVPEGQIQTLFPPAAPERLPPQGVGQVIRPLRPEQVDVVLLCGGRGTRLGPLTAQVPKPLLPVNGRPFLLSLLLRLKGEGFRRFILAAHYLSGRFEQFMAESQDLLPELELVVEPEPLGTGGAVRHAVRAVRSSTFVALNGDTWVNQELKAVLEYHQRRESLFSALGVAAERVEGGSLQKGVWQVGVGQRIMGFSPHGSSAAGWVNAGVYVMEREFVLTWPTGSYSLEESSPLLLKGKKAYLYRSDGRLLDIGTPIDYQRADEVVPLGGWVR